MGDPRRGDYLKSGDEYNRQTMPISRSILNYYPSCGAEICLKAVGQFLDCQSQKFLEKQCILDTLGITMASNTCNFMGRHFTQIDGATIGGPESASLTEIYGAVFIDSKIQKNIINDEDWKRYRDDSFFKLCKLVKKEILNG